MITINEVYPLKIVTHYILHLKHMSTLSQFFKDGRTDTIPFLKKTHRGPLGLHLLCWNTSFWNKKFHDSEATMLHGNPNHIEKPHDASLIWSTATTKINLLVIQFRQIWGSRNLQIIPAPTICIFPGKASDLMEHSQAIPTMPCLNSWLPESMSKMQLLLLYANG